MKIAEAVTVFRTKRPGIFRLIVGAFAIFPAILFVILSLSTTLTLYRSNDEARLQSTARALASAVDAQLGRYVSALETLATSNLLDSGAAAGAFEERARTVGARLGGWIVLIGPPPDYMMRANSLRVPGTPLPSALPKGHEQALLPALDEVFQHSRPAISDLFPGAVADRLVLAALVPVERPGQTRRALALALKPTAMRELLLSQNLPPGTFAAIADSQFRILAHSFDPTGRRVGARAPEWVGKAIGNRQSTLVVGPGWSGNDNVYAVERLSVATGWTVTVAEAQASLQGAAWKAVQWLLLASTALGVTLASVAWILRREDVRHARREVTALLEGQKDVERLLDGLPAVIFLREVAPDGTTVRSVYRGGDIEGVFGWPSSDLERLSSLTDLVHPDDPKPDEYNHELLSSGRVAFETRIRQPSGSWGILHTYARVLTLWPDGGAEIVGYTIDVTARRDAEARALTSARLASLGEMAAGLVHELRQPLGTIGLAASNALAALDDGDVESARHRLQRIEHQTNRAARLIDNLRQLSRTPDSDLSLEDIDLNLVSQDSLEILEHTFQQDQIYVDLQVCNEAIFVRGRKLPLEQALINILMNSRDALAKQPYGPKRQIRISVSRLSNADVQINFSDNGGGIPETVLTRLFEPFVTTKSATEGTGLGLAITRRLIWEMGGEIRAANDENGATFIVTLKSRIGHKISDKS
jgi:C4-dicarboxylate-specific signal transduction histidine kinase